MPQDLTQLPAEAEFTIGGWIVKIQDHKCANDSSLFCIIVSNIYNQYFGRQTLRQFEEHGISFETVVENCVVELEGDTNTLTRAISWHSFINGTEYSPLETNWNKIRNFSRGVAGRAVADQLVEKIRSCNNWEELYDELHLTSKFNKALVSRVKREMKQQCRKV